jgi:hypothetical protein
MVIGVAPIVMPEWAGIQSWFEKESSVIKPTNGLPYKDNLKENVLNGQITLHVFGLSELSTKNHLKLERKNSTKMELLLWMYGIFAIISLLT